VPAVDDELRGLASAQGGVLSRAQLDAAGVPPSRLGTPVRPRELVRLRQGVYAEAAVLRDADDARRTALGVAAARLTTGADLVAVGATAALVHGLPVLGRPGRLRLAERKQFRARHHGTGRLVLEAEVEEVHGVPVTSLPRTAVDVARTGFAAGVVTADAVLRRGVERGELELVVDISRRWPGRLTALDVVAFADPLAETALESLGRARFHEAGLPPPEPQVWIADAGGRFARVDHCWRDRWTIAEADGALKYDEPGALFLEKQREDRLRELGFEVVRYTWDEVLRRPAVVVARIERAFQRAALRRAA
jgi:hypothetical protein